MAFQDEPCLNCKMPIIRAMTDKDIPLALEIDPSLAGTWKLSSRFHGRPLAAKPSAHLAFGVKLYTEHACRTWTKR